LIINAPNVAEVKSSVSDREVGKFSLAAGDRCCPTLGGELAGLLREHTGLRA